MATAPQQQQQRQEPTSLVVEQFGGVNTATTRPGVPDQQCYWIDGFFPLSERDLRTMYGIGSALYTTPGGLTIVCYYFYNIGSTPYVVIFLSDGSAVQVNTTNGSTTTILTSGTIITPSITNIGVSQYGQQYALIVANQPNGYWVWNGSILYEAGSISPVVTITNVGSGYFAPPTIAVSGGQGSGVVLSATVANGEVTSVKVVNPGSGYIAGDNPTLTFSGGNQAGSGGSLTAVMGHSAGGSGGTVTLSFRNIGGDGYELTSVNVTSGGSGYSPPPQLTLSFSANPAGTQWQNNAPPTLTVGEAAGVITGAGFTSNPSNPFTVFLSPSGQFPTVNINDAGYYFVSSVTIVSGGSGYGPSCMITVAGGGVLQQATINPVLSSGVIVNTDITFGGVYSSNTPPTLTVADTKTDATATISLMAIGIQGNAVQTYQGHVWVFNQNNFNFSAPGSVSDFATSDGGGSDQSTANYLRVGYTQAISTNGFLFLIGDSSMDYISGVQTNTPSGGSPTTTFTQNNCDPEVGTPYPAAVTTLGQDILVANSAGIFVSSGGAFVKQSEPLDGVFNTVPASNFNSNPFDGFELSAAKATILGKRVWMVLAPIIDPVSGNQVNKLLMYNGRIWWASTQDVPLTFIQGQEINSIFQAWGTDGTHLYPLFSQPSTAFTKLVQSKLWDMPGGYEANKVVSRFWSIWQCYNTTNTTITLDVDSVGIDPSGNQFTDSETTTLAGPAAIGLFVTPPQKVAANGTMIGMTISTNAADMALISAKIASERPTQYRG